MDAIPNWVIGAVAQIPIAGVVGWAFITNKIHSDAELKRREKDHADEIARKDAEHLAQIAYIEQRRVEERNDRILAEQRLDRFIEAMEKSEELMSETTRELISRGSK